MQLKLIVMPKLEACYCILIRIWFLIGNWVLFVISIQSFSCGSLLSTDFEYLNGSVTFDSVWVSNFSDNGLIESPVAFSSDSVLNVRRRWRLLMRDNPFRDLSFIDVSIPRPTGNSWSIRRRVGRRSIWLLCMGCRRRCEGLGCRGIGLLAVGGTHGYVVKELKIFGQKLFGYSNWFKNWFELRDIQ